MHIFYLDRQFYAFKDLRLNSKFGDKIGLLKHFQHLQYVDFKGTIKSDAIWPCEILYILMYLIILSVYYNSIKKRNPFRKSTKSYWCFCCILLTRLYNSKATFWYLLLISMPAIFLLRHFSFQRITKYR